MPYAETNQESVQEGAGNGHDESTALNHSRQAKAEVEHLAETLRQARLEWEDLLRQRFRERPYATLAVAVGVGYVIGGGLAPGVIHTLASTGSRLALGVFLQRLMSEPTFNPTQESTE